MTLREQVKHLLLSFINLLAKEKERETADETNCSRDRHSVRVSEREGVGL